jgi:acyl carrier protein
MNDNDPSLEGLRQALVAELATRYRVSREALHDDSELFSSGLVDSLGVMEVVGVVERELGRTVPGAAITLENFDTIARILAFARKLGAGKA